MEKHDLAVNLPQDLDPVYANRIQIAYKDDEFTFVFLHEIPGTNHARAKAIVSISPKHAKNFSGVLSKMISDYEEKFGEINTTSDSKNGVDSGMTIRGYS
ncbi:hypothetical protein J2128_000878 [Methanomicrobium sp. W14]|jgi:hypothetical protein|uniref:DUF3467 domain-containing protein n=1 Tax=Methanomicrobium sp. W14 TaxID=2817839 RepID=UPI001AE32EBA|nr:DUF3467 domain-containing protein [Methanomicrobium sp. W14]MBP2132957.1 hypothetical protein [Methanomicrobium sp. W14]